MIGLPVLLASTGCAGPQIPGHWTGSCDLLGDTLHIELQDLDYNPDGAVDDSPDTWRVYSSPMLLTWGDGEAYQVGGLAIVCAQNTPCHMSTGEYGPGYMAVRRKTPDLQEFLLIEGLTDGSQLEGRCWWDGWRGWGALQWQGPAEDHSE